MSRFRPRRGRRLDGVQLALGFFAAIQTFVFFARRDRFEVLFWWTGESWLYVTLLWIKNLALAAAAFLGFAWIARATARLPEPGKELAPNRHALLFAAILAAGTALRWIAPQQIPPGVWADALFEAEGALREPGAVPWLGGRPLEIEGLRQSALVSHLYLKFCGLLFTLFGRGDAGLLALSAVGGTLALPAIYWLGRELGGPRRGLLAMALLAFAGWPLVFSRWAWTAALLLALVLCAGAAAVRARRTGHLGWAAVAGLAAGLSLHTYVSAWAVAAAFGAFALAGLRRPGGGKLALVAAGAALLAFLPFGLAFLEYPERIGGRAQDVSLLAPTKDVAIPGGNRPEALPLRVAYNAIEYTGLLLWTRDPNPRHGPPDRSPVDPALGLAALVGCAIAWRKAREGDAGHGLLLLIAGASLLAGILGNPGGAPNGLRIYPFAGATMLWAAESLDRWIPAAGRGLGARPGFAWVFALSIFVVAETVPFLTAWPRDPLVVGSFCSVESAGGRIRRSLGEAPTILDPRTLSWPIVFETLAASAEPATPVPRLPRMAPGDLLASPPPAPAWYVTSPDSLEKLRRGGWRCSRGIAPMESRRDTVISRVVPGKPAVAAPASE